MTRYLYQQPLRQFLQDIDSKGIEKILTEQMLAVDHQEAKPEERKSWRRSLAALADVLRDEALSRSEIFVELFMPLNGRRCDVMLTGRTAQGPSAVVIELKQWTHVKASHLPEHVFGGGRNSVHPSIQVGDYVATLRYNHSAFTGAGEPIALEGCVFLHDLDGKDSIEHLRHAVFSEATQRCPLFFKREHAALGRWLEARLVPGPGDQVAERVRAGHPLPSPKLLDLVVQTIQDQHDWRLLDEQKTAYFMIRHAVVEAKMTRQQKVVIVHGGPGTGKSVIALQLLAMAARDHWVVAHATGSQAFQTVLQGRTLAFAQELVKKIHGARTKKALPVADLFTTFADIARLGARDPKRLELTICDEAHRLWEYRRMKFPNGTIKRLSETPMAKEVIAASLVTAFFLDDHQSVRSGEIGSSRLLAEAAAEMGVPVEHVHLDAQFRCAGSASYIRWVEGLLGRRDGLDLEWREDGVYDLKIWEDMPKLDDHLRRLLAEGRSCRLLAGYCWRWSDPDPLGKLPLDLDDPRFGGWRGAWIERSEQARKPLENRYYLWAMKPESYEQVGSIYSAQGFEFDHVGVIWGEDLVWRGDRWVAQLDKNRDPTFKRDIQNSGVDPLEKLRNVYRVLLTRGMRSTHLFILDEETREHVRACAEAKVALPLAVGMMPGGADPAEAPPARSAQGGQVLRFTQRERGRLRPATPDPREPWRGAVPLIDLRAAAGGFSAEQLLREAPTTEEWYTWDGAPPFRRGDFLARVVGSSMAPDIPGGALCLFRLSNLETATGRPVLARLAVEGEEFASYTVKDLHVEWGEGSTGHGPWKAIELRPRNQAHPTLRLTPEEGGRLAILAEVVAVVASD